MPGDESQPIKRGDIQPTNIEAWSLGKPSKAREFEITLTPLPDYDFGRVWGDSRYVLVSQTRIKVTRYRDALRFSCPDALIEEVVLAVDEELVAVNNEIKRRHLESEAGTEDREREAKEQRDYAEQLRQRLERIPPPAE